MFSPLTSPGVGSAMQHKRAWKTLGVGTFLQTNSQEAVTPNLTPTSLAITIGPRDTLRRRIAG